MFIKLVEEIESKTTTVERGRLFNDLVIKSQFPLDHEKFIDTDGSGDGGIDSYWISESKDSGEDVIYIIQSKYGSSFRGPDTIRTELTKLQECLEDDDFLGNQGSHLNIRTCLSSRDNEKILNYVFGVSKDLSNSEYKCLEAGIQNLYALGFSEVNYSVVTIDKIVESFEYHTSVIPITLKSYAMAGKEQLCGYTTMGELLRISKHVSKMKDPNMIFSKNVRLDLGGRGKVNQDIQNVVETDPYRLVKLNLGITIVTRGELKDTGGGTFNILGLNIINGAQSFCSIIRGLQGTRKSKGESNLPLDARVHVEIIQAKSDKEEKDITLARNTSNKVKKAALCAIEGEASYRKLRDMLVSKFGGDFEFNLKAVSEGGISGSHDVMSTAGSIVGLFGTAITPTAMLMPNDNNPEEFSYKLINKLISNPASAALTVFIANKCLEGLQSNAGFNKPVARSTYRGHSGTYVLMQVIFKLFSEISKNKKLISTVIQDYIDNLEAPGISVSLPDKFSEIGLSLLKDDVVRKFLIGLSSGIWDEYALNPLTKKRYLYADYYDRHPEKKEGESKPNDRELNKLLTSKHCPRLSGLVSKTIDDIMESGKYTKELDKIRQIIIKAK